MKSIKYSKHLNNKSGFTLIEVLIAITVLAFLMANIYTMVENSTRAKEDITSEDRDILLVQAALERFAIDFSQIYSPLYFSAKVNSAISNKGNPSFDDDPQSEASTYIGSERYPAITVNNHLIPVVESADKSELIFMTSSNRRILENSKQSRYSWVRYSVRSAKDEPRHAEAPLELIRAVSSTSPYSKDFNWDKVKEYVLLRNLKSLHFEYWNPDREKFVESIKMLDDHKWTPRLVKIKLEWVNNTKAEISEERTFRTLWPYFDAVADEKLKNTFPNQDGSTSGLNESGDNSSEEEL